MPRAARAEWHRFLTGDNPAWPEEALRRDLEEVRRRMAGVRADPSTSDTRLSDDMNHLNPACTEALIRTMLGGLLTGRVGYPLHCQLRYFDLEARRAGLPPDVGALVHAMDAEGIEVELVNLNVREPRTIQVQLGAYGEHAVSDLRLVDGRQAEQNALGERDSVFEVVMEPGCGGRLTLGLRCTVGGPPWRFPGVGPGRASEPDPIYAEPGVDARVTHWRQTLIGHH